MEYTKEDYLNVKYNECKDVLEIGKSRGFFRKSKVMKIFLIITVISTIANLFLIKRFFDILFYAM